MELRAGAFTVLVGEAVAQYAHAYLTPAFQAGDELTVTVRGDRVSEQNYQVSVALEFRVSRGGHEVFKRVYDETGPGNYWNALGNPEGALRESTNVALRSVFKQFLSEAQRESASW